MIVFQDQFEKQTMTRYDWGRSVHRVLQRMAKFMENMFVEDKRHLGNDCHSTSANSTDPMETT